MSEFEKQLKRYREKTNILCSEQDASYFKDGWFAGVKWARTMVHGYAKGNEAENILDNEISAVEKELKAGG